MPATTGDYKLTGGTPLDVRERRADYVSKDAEGSALTTLISADAHPSVLGADGVDFAGETQRRTRTVTTITGRDSNGRVTSSETVLFTTKQGSDVFQPTAIKRNGEWAYSDPNYPTMAGVADAAIQHDLKNTNSLLSRSLNNGVTQAINKSAAVDPNDKEYLLQGWGNKTRDKIWDDANPPSGLTSQPQNVELSPDNVKRSKQNDRGQGVSDGTRLKNFTGPDGLRFPSDLGNSDMDVIKFDLVPFKPREFTSTEGNLSGLQDRAKGKSIGSVILPIPGGIQENFSVGFGDGTMSPMQAAGAKVMDAAFGKGGIEKATEAFGNTAKNIVNNPESRAAIEGYFQGQALGLSMDQILARTRGMVTNNNLELLFQGPVLRPFNFNFKLSPRDEGEAATIRQIIRFFKQGMAPQRSKSQLFLKAPHMFEIKYLVRGKGKHPSLNSFKTCACIGFTVNYTPDGTYNTFDDPGASMTAYELRMQFKELDPVYNEDYGNSGSEVPAEVGFIQK